jgi:hypothetical protein
MKIVCGISIITNIQFPPSASSCKIFHGFMRQLKTGDTPNGGVQIITIIKGGRE